MGASKKSLNNIKTLLTGGLRKNGIILWRYIFNAREKESGEEKSFFIELEMLNPYLSPSEEILGFKSRTAVSAEDLQYALAGTKAAMELETEKILQPSFVSIRFGAFGKKGKQFALYDTIHNTKISQKPFSIQVGNCSFTESHLSGFISYTEKEILAHPEYMCNHGYAEWNLDYEIIQDFDTGYQGNPNFWIPIGIKTNMSGTVTYCGTDYIINPLTSFGYFDKFSGKTLPAPWFHISASSLTSLISGRTLFDSSFASQGIYNDMVSLLLNFEGNKLEFCAENKKKYNCVWDCQQSPARSEDDDSEELHWSASLNNKNWVVDIDIYCKITELTNRVIELPEGKRKTLSIVACGTGRGEIKL